MCVCLYWEWGPTWVGGGGEWGEHQHGWVSGVGWTSTLNTTCEIVVLATLLQNIETAAYHVYKHSTVITHVHTHTSQPHHSHKSSLAS